MSNNTDFHKRIQNCIESMNKSFDKIEAGVQRLNAISELMKCHERNYVKPSEIKFGIRKMNLISELSECLERKWFKPSDIVNARSYLVRERREKKHFGF